MRVGYICDGGGLLGWGHVWRGRGLVQLAGPGSALIVAGGADELAAWFAGRGMADAFARWAQPGAPLEPAQAPYDVLVIDHYTLDADWIAAAARHRPTYVVDDWMRESFSATGLINPNIGARRDDYPGVSVRDWLVGSTYALVRGEVFALGHRSAVIRPDASHVLVTMGGSDPDGVSAVLAELLADMAWYRTGELTIVLGASYRGPEPWQAWSGARRSRCEVVRQPDDFLARCLAADVVICGASTISNELAFLGRPFVPVAFVDNQATIAARWAEAGIGAGVDTRRDGWRDALVRHLTGLLDSAESRQAAAERAAGLVDGQGGARLLEAWRKAA